MFTHPAGRIRISEDTSPFSRLFRGFVVLFCTAALLWGHWFAIPAFLVFWYVSEPGKVLEFDHKNLYLIKNGVEETVPLQWITNLDRSYWSNNNNRNYVSWVLEWKDPSTGVQSIRFMPTQDKEDWVRFIKYIRKRSPGADITARKYYNFWGFEVDRS